MHRYPGPRMHVRRQGRRNDNNMSPMIMMLLMQIYQRYEELPVKPPVTFALVAYNVGAHVYPAMVLPYSLDAVCLSSYTFLSAWYRSDWGGVFRRTVLSAFTHADDMHLYYNMGSLLVKGVQLEQKMGSEAFGGFVAFAVVVAHLLSVVVGVGADSMGYQTGCAVGFSGVLFAMKLVLNHGAHAPGSGATSRVWGVKIASRHAHWLEILVASYFNPRSSIVGHACGALAGYLWTATPQLRALLAAKLRAKRGAARVPPRQGRDRYTYAAGTAGQAPAAAPAPAEDADWERVPPAAPARDDAELRRRRVERFG